MIYIVILALIGLVLSLYAHHLEQKIKSDPHYKASCDINDRISCTRPLLSPYANFFYLPNSLLGIFFYGTLAVVAFCGLHAFVLIMAIAGIIASCVLAYLLYFEIKSFCIVCTSLYVVNILILLCALWCKS
jgi:vitamin-K-epoxide reductase (warfarin-sensitive)